MTEVNLPRERTAFVGRETELAELAARMNEGEQLIVVTGPGGAGKTRLIVHFARGLFGGGPPRATDFSFVDLAGARTSGDLCRSVARAFDARVGAVASAEELVHAVGGAIAAHRELLLVLDNFEQIEPLAAEVIRTWCDAAPHAVFVVTSRRRLGLEGEAVLELGPLPVPATHADPRALEENPAVRLFLDRAKRARPGFCASPDELERIGRLVRALDGLPLAIELCASKMHVLGSAELIEQLGCRFELLVDAQRGRSERQESLRATIDWSYDLLAPTERAVLAQCSVFRQGFSIDAAEHVLAIDAVDGETTSVLDAVTRLVEQSLVFSLDAPGMVGERRFALLESIRDYAARQLSEEQAEQARSRHADYFGARAVEWSFDRDAPDARRKMVLDADNLIAAAFELLRRARASGVWSAFTVEAVASLEPLFLSQGPLEQFLSSLDAVVDGAEASGTAAALALARARRCRGWSRAVAGRAGAVEDLQRALSELDEHGDLDDRVAVRSRLAMAALLGGDNARAGEHFAAGLALLAPGVSGSTRVELLWRFANYLRQIGEIERALRASEEALCQLAAAGDRRDEAIVLLSIADCYLELGSVDPALGYYDRALARSRELADRRVEAQATTHRAVALLESGQPANALRVLDGVLAVHRDVGNRVFEGLTHVYRGLALFELGDADRACESFDASLSLLNIRYQQGLVLGARAITQARRNRGQAARADLALARERLGASAAELVYLELVQRYLDLSEAIACSETPENLYDPICGVGKGELPTSFEIRFTLRALSTVSDPPAERARARKNPELPRLRLAEDGRWFQLDDEAPVEFRRQGALRNLLLRLASEHERAPGAPLSLQTLREAGWPGERMLSESAQNRVYVAVCRLRQRGLGALLISRDDGWLLDPSVIVEWAFPVSRPR